MGWLSTLAKVGLVGAAPFTGGASLAALPAVDALGGVLSGAGAGATGSREEENRLRAQQDFARSNIFGTQQNAATNLIGQEEGALLDRAELGLRAPETRARQTALGSLLANVQPAQFSNLGRVKVPQLSGGLTPAALSSTARQAGGALETQALEALLSGSDIPDMPDFAGARLTPPDLSEIKGPGKLESILSGVGTGLSALGALGAGRGAGTPPLVPEIAGAIDPFQFQAPSSRSFGLGTFRG